VRGCTEPSGASGFLHANPGHHREPVLARLVTPRVDQQRQVAGHVYAAGHRRAYAGESQRAYEPEQDARPGQQQQWPNAVAGVSDSTVRCGGRALTERSWPNAIMIQASGPITIPAHLLPGSSGSGENEPGGRLGASALGKGQHAGIRVGSDHDARVAEQVLQRLEVGTSFVGEGRRAVAQVVQPNWGHIGLPDEFGETLGEVAGVDGRPVGAGEHVPRVTPDLPGGAASGHLFKLPAAVLAQHGHGVPVECHGPGAGDGLGCALDDPVAGGGPVADDEQHAVVEIQFAPAQSGGLTAAQPAQRDQPPHGEQPVAVTASRNTAR
jgi:hypothetical protein